MRRDVLWSRKLKKETSMTRHNERILAQNEREREIHEARAALADKYVDYIRNADEMQPAEWSRIVVNAREAGLKKRDLCRELSCSWSTILRWEAGDTLPGPFARRAIKAKLLEMITSIRSEEQRRVEEPVPA
jgi:ribosome-binding protein aMBF1 (putative translation factor)